MTSEPARYTFGAVATSDHKEDTMTTTTTAAPARRAITQARLERQLAECHAAFDRAVRRGRDRQRRLAEANASNGR